MFIQLFENNNKKNSNSYIIQNTPKTKVQFLKILKQYNTNILIKNIYENYKNIFEVIGDDYYISPQSIYDSLTKKKKEDIAKYYIGLDLSNPLKKDQLYIKTSIQNIKNIYFKQIHCVENTMTKIFLDNLHLEYIPQIYVEGNTKDKKEKERSTKDKYNDFENSNWSIYFPKTNETYYIYETISNEVLNNGIGHFSETKKQNGNIALAGHNRGYKVNSFSHLKDIQKGEEIYYKYGKKIFKYIVSTKEKISEYDYSKVERTGNFLTLITCVENVPELRLCVTAIRK